MNMNKLTEKAQEAVQTAQRLAEEHRNTQLEPEHLLTALASQEDGVVPAVLDRLGVSPTTLLQQVRSVIDGMARASGDTQLYLSSATNRVFTAAEKEAERLKDDYVSTEHLLLALATLPSVLPQLRLRFAPLRCDDSSPAGRERLA